MNNTLKQLFCVGIVIFSFFASFRSFAQGGCLLPDGNLYTTYTALLGKTYNSSPAIGLSSGYCSWMPQTTGPSCKVCFGLGIAGACVGTLTYGQEGSFTMISCDIDDYAIPITFATGFLGFYIIRNRGLKRL